MQTVIIGSSGTIGEAVTALVKKKGHQVMEASRSTTPAIDITDPASIDRFYSTLRETDAIICAAGTAAIAPIDKLNEDELALSVNSKLLGQVNLVRKGISRLRANGVMVITGGMLAYYPWPQTSMLAMVNAGLEGFVKAVALDLTDGKRILIVHPPWVAETAAKLGMDASPWPNAAKTAEAYLSALEGSESGTALFVDGYTVR